jgi:hypothetical protein
MATRSKKIICTLFDHRYMPRGLCLIDSIREQGGRQEIWVLALSGECVAAMASLALPGVRVIPLEELERHLPALLEAKANRQAIEYYFTCMAALHRFIFDTVPEADGTMYVDADMLFFASPDIVFDAIGDAPAAVIPHNFSPSARQGREKFGLYNAGWSAFRRTPEGETCLNWWLERSIEWCYDRVNDDGRYANQAYLDHFQRIAPHTRVLSHKGFNCAPWNVGGYRVSLRDGHVFVDDQPLVFFHFHGLKLHYNALYFDCHREYGAPTTRIVRNCVYRPYIRRLIAAQRRVAALRYAGQTATAAPPLAHYEMDEKHESFLARLPRRLRGKSTDIANRLLDIISGRPLLVWGDHVW